MTASNASNIPLISGAGPVGLAAALFLRQHGIKARLIETKEDFSPYSRALAVNPRSLELLETTGVTASILECGLAINQVHFWKHGKLVASGHLSRLNHKYPFMVALSQSSTEKLLAEALEKLGGKIERGVELVGVKQAQEKIEVNLKSRQGNEQVFPQWLLAGDGAHSKIREELKLDFPGSTFKEPWYLADVPLSTPWPYNSAHVHFLEGSGFIFFIPVIEDKRQPRNQIWRIITNFPNPLAALTNVKLTGKPVWESSFHIAHRIVNELQVGNVYLAGDAAHIHSPLGARGMNLGIEDAYVFAELMHQDRAHQYQALRKKIDQSVVRRIKLFTTIVRGQSGFTRALRSLMPVVIKTPFLFDQIAPILTGLDHEVKI